MNAVRDDGGSNLEGQRQAKLSPAFPAMEGSACAAGRFKSGACYALSRINS